MFDVIPRNNAIITTVRNSARLVNNFDYARLRESLTQEAYIHGLFTDLKVMFYLLSYNFKSNLFLLMKSG